MRIGKRIWPGGGRVNVASKTGDSDPFTTWDTPMVMGRRERVVARALTAELKLIGAFNGRNSEYTFNMTWDAEMKLWHLWLHSHQTGCAAQRDWVDFNPTALTLSDGERSVIMQAIQEMVAELQ